MRKVIGVDVDGVVADLHTVWVDIYNQQTGDTLRVSEITDWAVPPFMNKLSHYEAVQIIKDPSIYDYVEPIHGAIEAIEAIRAADMQPLFVTHCYRRQFRAKLNWLRRNGFTHHDDEVIAVSSEYKWVIGTDVLIDDNTRTVQSH